MTFYNKGKIDPLKMGVWLLPYIKKIWFWGSCFKYLFIAAPATFSESMFGPKNIKDAGDNQYTQGNLEYAPRYPVFNFEDK